MKLKLVEASAIKENEYLELINEIKDAGESFTPSAIDPRGQDFRGFIQRLNDESQGINLPESFVPASTFFLIEDQGKIIGAINIRHQLNDALKKVGGHIGYGIRPTARKQGYGTTILKLGLDKVREIGLMKVMISCHKTNPASAKVIVNNGGILDSELELDDEIIQRYWLELKS